MNTHPASPKRSPILDAFYLHYRSLRSAAERVLRSPESAADVVQDTYLKIAAMDQNAVVDNPLAFLHRITRNLSIDRLREKEVRDRHVDTGYLPDDVADGSPGGEQHVLGQQRLAWLAMAVDELPPKCREIFRMRKVELMHPEQIADALGISRNMVEKHLRKALIHCQSRLDELER
jgi:RNA polymerase sigma-70 factor (ECF subfamily)